MSSRRCCRSRSRRIRSRTYSLVDPYPLWPTRSSTKSLSSSGKDTFIVVISSVYVYGNLCQGAPTTKLSHVLSHDEPLNGMSRVLALEDAAIAKLEQHGIIGTKPFAQPAPTTMQGTETRDPSG